MDPLITVCDDKQQRQTFAAIDDAVTYITRAPHATFRIYAPRNVYDAIAKQVFDQENSEDYASIWHYKLQKGSVTSWSDIDDLNDMIDHVEERLSKRKQRLIYGGESAKKNLVKV